MMEVSTTTAASSTSTVAYKRELQASSCLQGSNGTAATVESDWESHLEKARLTVPLNPWSLFLAIRDARILTVEPVVFLYFFGLDFVFPLYQQYYLKRASEDVLRNTSHFAALGLNHSCIDKAHVNNWTGDNTTYDTVVESNATLIYVLRSLVSATLVIFTVLVTGPLSDRYGRRLVILLVAVGGVLQGLGSVVIVRFDLDLRYFVIIGFIEGCFGNFATMLMASFAYISDISSGKWRTVRLGVAESMLFFGALIALKTGQLWFQELGCDFMPPLYLYIACNLAIIAYTLLFLPESLTSEDRRRKNAGKPSGVRALMRGLSIFFCRVPEYPVWKLWLALVGFFLVVAFALAGQSINVFFFGDLNWSPRKTGNYQAVSTGSHMLALMVVLPLLVTLKLHDTLIGLIGIAANVSMNLLLGLSSATYQIFIAGSLNGLEAVASTPLRGYMSKIVHVEDQGALFSVIASVESFSNLLSICYSYILPVLLHHHLSPGMVYVILAGLGLIPVPLLSILLAVWCKERYFRKFGQPLDFSSETSESEQESERTPIFDSQRYGQKWTNQSPPQYSPTETNVNH